MAKLIYSAITSLDGYLADEDGNFAWAEPDEEVHAFVNDLERPVGTYLYGRRMYEVMVARETMDTGSYQTPVMRDFAELWRAAEKIVYSKTLETVSSARTRIERDFDPRAVRQMKTSAERYITVKWSRSRRPGDHGGVGR
jgi:dihydrofolate reductase